MEFSDEYMESIESPEYKRGLDALNTIVKDDEVFISSASLARIITVTLEAYAEGELEDTGIPDISRVPLIIIQILHSLDYHRQINSLPDFVPDDMEA